MEININGCFKEAFEDTTPIILLQGGRASGKSYFCGQLVVVKKLMIESARKVLVVRKFATTLRNSVFTEIRKVITESGLEDMFEFTTSPLEITYKPTGGKIIFVGLDDAQKIKSISDIDFVWIEEADQIEEPDFSQIDLSIRGKSKYPKQIILSFNPVNKKSFLYKSFIVKKSYNFNIYHSTYRDNPFIDIKEYEKKLLQYQNDTVYYNMVANNEWGEVSETTIFTNWEVDTTLSGNYTDYKLVYGGCDFGVRDPNTAVLASLSEDTIYIIKEYYRGGITGNDMIRDMLVQMPLDVYYNCDSSQPSQIEEMKRAGIKALSVRKNKVVDGIEWLRSKKIKVHPSCIHVIQELDLYQWRQDKDGVILNEPLDTDNHTIDAIRYAFRELMGESMVGTVKATLRI